MKLAHQWLSPLLIIHIIVGTIPAAMAADQAPSPESFAFSEQSAPTAAVTADLSKSNNLNKRSAPVSNSGAFGHSLALDVPPGRLGMTPKLTLSYSSSAHRSEGELGAGWSLSTRSITRSTRNGFPAVIAGANGPIYDEAKALFEGPDGPMARVADGPSGVVGQLYAPVREHTSVRYEHQVTPAALFTHGSDLWIEHDPSGTKRYYGQFGIQGRLGSRSAGVANELGNHSWFLLEEVDPRGNNISYDYHLGPTPSSPSAPRQQPVLAAVRWGGNSSVFLPHLFEVAFNVSAKPGSLDMLNGHVRNELRIDSIEVFGPSTTGSGMVAYWRYALTYKNSQDTGQQLLGRLTRSAPLQPGGTTAQTQSWVFSYTGNAAAVRWDSSGTDFPASMKGAYVDYYVNPATTAVATTPQERFLARSHPTDSRSATKLIDLDGNGTLDFIYHPAGLARPDSPMIFEQSYSQTALASWQSLSSSPPSGWHGKSFSDFVDLDRDSDQDAVVFPSTTFNLENALVVQPEGEPDDNPSSFHGFCVKVANSCCAGSLSCDELNLPLFECSGGKCPDLEGYETVVYPPDLIAQIPSVPPFSINPANINTSQTSSFAAGNAAAASGGSLLCGIGRGVCNAYYNYSQFDYCRTPANTCASTISACTAFCASQLRDDVVDGDQMTMSLIRNPARCGQGTCSGTDTVTVSNWPRTARLWSATRQVIDKTNPNKPTIEYFPELAGTFYAPFADVNGDGLSDLVLLKQSDTFLGKNSKNTFIPRVYVSAGTSAAPSFKLDSERSTGLSFTASVRDNLTDSIPELCYVLGDRMHFHPSCANRVLPYPRSENFNTFLMDVNGDTLPDLVVARPPAGTVCSPGHFVYLNTGYGWEKKAQWALGKAWSAQDPAAAAVNHPFLLLRNYQRKYATAFSTEGYCAQAGNAPRTLPLMGAMTQADINADGRTDIVFAYQGRPASDPAARVERVYLNTVNGFVPAAPGRVAFPQAQYGSSRTLRPFALAIDWLVPSGGTAAATDALVPDMGRMVDVDGDGLVDLVTPGSCDRPKTADIITTGQIFNSSCRPPRWHRNLGVVPDLLARVESPGGSFVALEYVTATSAPGRAIVTGDAAAGMQVVSRVKRAAGPDPQETPVESIAMKYKNFVRDTESSEVVGFEEVEAEFANSFQGATTEKLTVKRSYGVAVAVTGASNVRFPIKGMVLETSSTSGGDVQRIRSRFRLAPLGQEAVQIRSSGEETEECTGATCATTARQARAFDGYGNVLEEWVGNFDGIQVSNDSQRLRTVRTYDNRSDGRWTIGLLSHEESIGYSEDVSGIVNTSRTLASRSWSYAVDGLPESATTHAVVPTNCSAGATDDVIEYSYHPVGVLKSSKENQRRTIVLEYDANFLYVAQQSVTFPALIDGVATGGTTKLVESAEHDLRHGQPTARVGLNGVRTATLYDSQGRMYEARGPAGQLLESRLYSDEHPASVVSTIASDTGKEFIRKTHLDGAGRELGVTEAGKGISTVRARRFAYDAFGRTVRVTLPRFASSLDDIAIVSSETMRVNVHDGFGRPTRVTQVDGHVTSSAYEPRAVVETNPRGFKSRREFDAHGQLIRLSRLTAGSVVLATTQYVRDGSGKVVRIEDADRSVRRIERDGAGQVHKLTLPHQPGSSAVAFTLCHDLDGHLVGATTPSKSITVTRDALGRGVKVIAASGQLTSKVLQTYDDPSSLAQGQLSRTVDDSGVYALSYDAFGRRATLGYAPTLQVLAGLANASGLYETGFKYNLLGELNSVAFVGVPGNVGVAYTRDVKGRIVSVESTGATGRRALATVRVYDARNRAINVDFGNGTSASWLYPSHQRLERLTYLNSSGAPMAAFRYGYDANGNVSSEDYTRDGLNIWAKAHGYDGQDRLVSTSLNWPFGSRSETHSFSPGGNVATAVGDVYSYDKGENAQAVTKLVGPGGTRSLQYDNDGQLESDLLVAPTGDKVERLINFLPTGCLGSTVERQTTPAGVVARYVTNSFLCAHDGQRVVRRTEDHLSGAVTKRIDIAAMGELRTDTNVLLLRLNINGATMVEEARSLSTGDRVRAESGYLHSDLRGSVVAKTDFDFPGKVAYREAAYDAWGAPLAVSTQPLPTRGFVDSEPDPVTGFHSFGRRSYDPKLRRWLSPDPLLWGNPEVDGEQLNLYAYSANNPATYTDKSGLVLETAWDLVNLAADAAAISQWNSSTSTLDKALDVFGLVVDAVAVVVPILPGGAGIGLTALRAGEKAVSTKALDSTVEVAKAADKASGAGNAANKAVGGQKLLPANAGPIAHISPSEVVGKTPAQIDARARDLGLQPKGPDPAAGRGAYVDPQTGQQRILSHPNASPPHGHVNNPAGQRIDANGKVVLPESSAAHLPIKNP